MGFKQNKHQTDFDTYWKKIITDLFDDFVAFFYPKLYSEIDWSRPYEFLEQELHNIISEKYKDTKSTDKLVKVYLKDGTETWILIHIEVQSFFEKDFAKRMLDYWVLLYTRYEVEAITALAIFTGKKIPKVYQKFETRCFGTQLAYQYNTYKVRDQKEALLVENDNPFALAVLACLYILKSGKDASVKLQFKNKLVRLALKKGWNKEKIAQLLIFIKGIVKLPRKLEAEFESKTKKLLSMYEPLPKSPLLILPKRDQDFFEEIFKHLFGETTHERAAKVAVGMAEELAEQMVKERSEKFKQEQEAKQIINLFQKLGLNAEQIANTLEIEEEKVAKILQEHKSKED